MPLLNPFMSSLGSAIASSIASGIWGSISSFFSSLIPNTSIGALAFAVIGAILLLFRRQIEAILSIIGVVLLVLGVGLLLHTGGII